MNDLRTQQLTWLDYICTAKKITLTDIARAAKLHPSTLTRFHATNDFGHTLTSSTVRKIEEAVRVPAYETNVKPHLIISQDGGDGVPFKPDEASSSPFEEILKSYVNEQTHLELWTLNTSALSAMGYCSGTVVAINTDMTPRSGDAVCAQFYDYRRGTAETVFRVFRPPYLLSAAASGEPSIPAIVDGEFIAIKGVVVGGWKSRD